MSVNYNFKLHLHSSYYELQVFLKFIHTKVTFRVKIAKPNYFL